MLNIPIFIFLFSQPFLNLSFVFTYREHFIFQLLKIECFG